jgi:hypothetical protein
MRTSQSAIIRLRDPNRSVRIYTFQHKIAYAAALERGYLTGPLKHAESDSNDPWNWIEQYQWMREQMAKRVPRFSGDLPVWAYVSRPNLRQQPYRPDSVLIVADVPRTRMLISDHSTWHIPLNRGFISYSEEEDDTLDQAHPFEAPGPRPICDAMKLNWERVFEIGMPDSNKTRKWLGAGDDLQACVDRVYMDEIIRITEEPGRLGRRGGREY